jgi:hypothetical protein
LLSLHRKNGVIQFQARTMQREHAGIDTVVEGTGESRMHR